jgi:hypothetical protein
MELVLAVGAVDAREAKVDDLDHRRALGVHEHDVLRLEVPVDDADGVARVDGAQELAEDPPARELAQRAAFAHEQM